MPIACFFCAMGIWIVSPRKRHLSSKFHDVWRQHPPRTLTMRMNPEWRRGDDLISRKDVFRMTCASPYYETQPKAFYPLRQFNKSAGGQL
jgi:hypothetical protein